MPLFFGALLSVSGLPRETVFATLCRSTTENSTETGYLLKAGQLEYDCRYSTMHGMPVTGGRGLRGLNPLWYNGVPP